MVEHTLRTGLRDYVVQREAVSGMIRAVCASHAGGHASTRRQVDQLRAVLRRLEQSERRMWASYAGRLREGVPTAPVYLELVDEVARAKQMGDALEQMAALDDCGARTLHALQQGDPIEPCLLGELADLFMALRAACDGSIVAFLSARHRPPPQRPQLRRRRR